MSKKSDLVISLPVYNLKISKDIGGILEIEPVTFVSAKKIPYIRKKLHLPFKVSEYNLQLQSNNFLKSYLPLFHEAPTYAFIMTSQKCAPDFSQEHTAIKKAIWILRSSQFTYCSRANDQLFGSIEHGSRQIARKYTFQIGGNKSLVSSSSLVTPVQEYILNPRWKDYMKKHHFFYDLLKIINGKVVIQKKWKNNIINSAILIARSYYSNELPEAFMYNIIALESLISTNDEKKISSSIYNNLYSFFGWMYKHPSRDTLKEIIKHLYKLRCDFVHRGDYKNIEIKDLLIADELLRNLFFNICRHIKFFSSKEKIIEFSEKIKAQETLGMKISRPIKFIYYSTSYSNARKIENIRKKKNW